METVKQAFAEVTTAFESLQHKRDEALHRCAELEVLLDAERSSASTRESALVDANSRLLAQVEEDMGAASPSPLLSTDCPHDLLSITVILTQSY